MLVKFYKFPAGRPRSLAIDLVTSLMIAEVNEKGIEVAAKAMAQAKPQLIELFKVTNCISTRERVAESLEAVSPGTAEKLSFRGCITYVTKA